MYKRNFNKDDFETHKLEITLVHNSGKWDYNSMAKVSMWSLYYREYIVGFILGFIIGAILL